jgi:TRAP-type mannitol/chloroaromatic compound transport system substrate-binding protein
MGGWFNKEIKTLADVQGLRMRIPGLGGEVFQRAGGEPVAMPGGDMYTALQTGTIDATDWVGPYNDLAFGLHTVAEYYYYPGWQEPGAVMETLVNKEAFEALPDDLQAIIEVATRAINEDMLAEYTARNNTALRELVNKHGVKVRPFPDDVLAKLREVSNEVLMEMGQTSPMAERIHASFTSFSADVKAWTAIAEQGYLDARRETD